MENAERCTKKVYMMFHLSLDVGISPKGVDSGGIAKRGGGGGGGGGGKETYRPAVAPKRNDVAARHLTPAHHVDSMRHAVRWCQRPFQSPGMHIVNLQREVVV